MTRLLSEASRATKRWMLQPPKRTRISGPGVQFRLNYVMHKLDSVGSRHGGRAVLRGYLMGGVKNPLEY